MPKCTESWDNCSGFWSCTGAAFETAAKCTASAAEDAASSVKGWATSWAKSINDKQRKDCYDKTVCLWNKYKAGKITKGQLYGGGLAWHAASQFFAEGGDVDDKQAFNEFIAKRWSPDEYAYQQSLTWCGQSFSDAWIQTISLQAISVAVGLGTGTGAKGYAVANGALGAAFGAYEADTGPCGEGYAKAAGAVVTAAGQFVAATGKEGVKEVVIIAGKGASAQGGAVLAETLKDFGIELPPEVLNVLACIEKSAGSGTVALAAFDAVSGNAEKAAKALAPFAVNCIGQEALAKLGPGPVQTMLKKALQLATAIAFQPPPPPPPLPALDCSVDGFNAYANAGDKASLVACYATQGIYGEQADQLADLFVKSNKLVPTQLAKASWLGDLSKVDLPKPPPPTRRPDNTALGLLVVGGLLLAAAGGGQ